MQPDRDAGFAGIENVERPRLGAIEIWSDYHHGGGINPPTHDEITDCDTDCRRHAVIIGTQPDMSTRAITPRISDIPVFHRTDRVGTSGSRQNRPTAASRCRIVLHTAI